jgi:HlyD family secretion protein
MANKNKSSNELEARLIPPNTHSDRRITASACNEWEVIVAESDRKTPSLRVPFLLGATTLIFGVGGFLLWSVTTSIAAASIATGKVIVAGQVKKVTLYEGGVLDKLFVKEGDRVKAGQILATLDTTRTKAELVQIEHQAIGLEVKRARLIAERDREVSFSYVPDKTSRYLDPGAIDNILSVEQKVFTERKKYLDESVEMERSLGDQMASQAHALEARLASYQEQISVIEADKKSLEVLFKKRLTTKTELSEKQISYMELQSKASLMEAAQKISQVKISIMNRETEFNREVVQSLQDVQIELAKTQQRIIAARDVVEKANIKSPQSGTVAKIDPDSRTRGSAVLAGKAILEVVPVDEELIIDGQLPTQSINDARIGAMVEVKLVNSDTYKLNPIFGTLTYVGADSISDEKTGNSYYPIHVKISKAELTKQEGIFLAPGVRAELFVINGERTAISYLTQPIRDSFSRAFRED